MTLADLIQRIKARLTFNKIDAPGAEAAITAALPSALVSLWNKYPWDEKRRTTSLSITSGDYQKDLPTDCEQVTAIGFAGTKEERDLDLVSEAFFDSYYPNLSQSSAGIPWLAKVVFNSERKKSELYIGPKSDGSYTLDVTYRRKVPDIAEVPRNLEGALMTLVLRDMFLPGTEIVQGISGHANQLMTEATNVNPKAAPIRSTMDASVREGRHIFNVSDGFQDE